jgi:hypothetical protein
MTSLMQGFTKARQIRIAERIKAVNELDIWQKQRSHEFQQEIIATHAMLAAETKQRLISEQDRLSRARLDATQRQREVQARILAVKVELEQSKEERLAMAIYDRQQRQQEFAQLKSQTQELLETAKRDRLRMASTLKRELTDYASYIHLSVWGMDFTNLLEESRSESEVVAYPAPIPAGIDEFIQDYIASLGGNLSLVQVVNDRDLVKDLLTTGANTLKVDPSEVLNALIKMVDLDN